ncbi:sugar ABC transporter substrate-binding protein [Muribacter muris]|uniref:Sugar ABC transporter substrate-binding protein n=1 Tax=Muribacter muris TaxID=67855 RepID=A0A4Y9K0Q4_9PAST|nr:substrate-binding domain-containing protein [Muribacter muris]MBF0785044.1 substrate-binding domain-containing protein [Muribacter muris]MBF0826741.1 substrate-binding domain-containing protein [Muribacter muris]TFV10285.1 sugar ABC transporter substrate-binding protein [Muribacter muris]
MKHYVKSTFVSIAILGLWSSHTFASDPFVEEVKQLVASATAKQEKWDGPTAGPQLQKDKTVIFIASDMKNGGVLGVIDGMKEAVAATGWKLDILDGAGTVNNQLAALNQAIARQPDAIVIGGWNPNVAKIPLKKAVKNGIILTAWHATPEPGAIDKYGIFYNVTSNSDEIAKLSAMLAVADSDGKAKVVILTDSLYEIALRKANVMKEVIEKCQACQVLEFIDTPLADTSSRMPNLTFNLLQKYGDNLQYALSINDLYFDFMAPSLRSANKVRPYNISAGDGSVTAYQRIRQNDKQFATVPEPLNLHGWQLVDELNRAFAGEKPSGYVTPAHLVTQENIRYDGGERNLYDPQNGYKQAYKAIWGIQ